jgi:hypothetical protein
VKADQPVQASNLVISHLTMNVAGTLTEDGLALLALLLALAEQLCVLLLLCAPPSAAIGAALALVAGDSGLLFLILSVDLLHDLPDLGVWARVDEMSEQVGQAKQVAESPDRVILFALAETIMLLSQNSLAQRVALPAAFATICGCGISCYAVGGSCWVGLGICVVGSVEHDVRQGAVAGSEAGRAAHVWLDVVDWTGCP